MGWEKEIVFIDKGEQQKTETKHKKQAGNFNMIFLCKGQYRKEKEKKKQSVVSQKLCYVLPGLRN